jgi:hypothetical protein
VAAILPDTGESAGELSSKFPGSTLTGTLQQVAGPGGGTDLYIDQTKFPQQVAADLRCVSRSCSRSASARSTPPPWPNPRRECRLGRASRATT